MFDTLFFQPILSLVVLLYNIIPGSDLGVVIIILTILIKIVLYPLSQKSLKSQKSLQELQPKINEIKKQYEGKKEEMGRAMMELYKNNKVNPLSSCLPLLIQLPFLYAVFQVLNTGLKNGSLDLVYSFIDKPDHINTIAFGFLNLSEKNLVLALMAGAAQFWQSKMMMTQKSGTMLPEAKDEDLTAIMNKQMLYFMPAMTVFIGMSFPGGLALYWFVTTILTVFQQMVLFKKK